MRRSRRSREQWPRNSAKNAKQSPRRRRRSRATAKISASRLRGSRRTRSPSGGREFSRPLRSLARPFMTADLRDVRSPRYPRRGRESSDLTLTIPTGARALCLGTRASRWHRALTRRSSATTSRQLSTYDPVQARKPGRVRGDQRPALRAMTQRGVLSSAGWQMKPAPTQDLPPR